MANLIHVLWVIWGAGSFVGFVVAFILFLVLDGEKAGYSLMAAIVLLGSMCGAIAVNPG